MVAEAIFDLTWVKQMLIEKITAPVEVKSMYRMIRDIGTGHCIFINVLLKKAKEAQESSSANTDGKEQPGDDRQSEPKAVEKRKFQTNEVALFEKAINNFAEMCTKDSGSIQN